MSETIKKGFILITRPKPQAKILSRKLESKGYKTLMEPLMEIKNCGDINYSQIDPEKIAIVLITSHNAIFALAKFGFKENILILAVGKKTGAKIKEAGYKNVVSANNSAADLEKLTRQILAIKKGAVLYLSGVVVTLDLAEKLRKNGVDAKRIKVYFTKPKHKLSANIISKIRAFEIDQVLIYSLETARIFHHLILKHNLLEYFDDVKLLCLSRKISEYLKNHAFKNIGISKIE